ncbi:MAG: GH25 family lysozyme [Kofleriaceae bacterium]
MPRRNRWPFAIAATAGCIAVVFALAWWLGGEDEPVAPPECRTGPTTAGIDVSYYQEVIAWPKVRKAGVLFAFIRVSDGSTFPDPMFETNWREAAKVGVLRGSYQYFRPEENPIAQADILIAALRRDHGELPPVLDVEHDGGKSPAQIARGIELWVARVRTRLGVEPIIYTGPDFWQTRVGNADFTRQPLWLAHYTTTCPTIPAPWTTWAFWQYTSSGKVPGIYGPTDLDVFAGTFADLEEFARNSWRTPTSASR